MSATEILELPEQKVDVSPSTELWYTCIKSHADVNWPKEWTWRQILHRMESIPATPSPDQLWDMHVMGFALGHPQFRPTQVKALSSQRLKRIQLALQMWGKILVRDMQFHSQRQQVAKAIRRQLERLGQRV